MHLEVISEAEVILVDDLEFAIGFLRTIYFNGVVIATRAFELHDAQFELGLVLDLVDKLEEVIDRMELLEAQNQLFDVPFRVHEAAALSGLYKLLVLVGFIVTDYAPRMLHRSGLLLLPKKQRISVECLLLRFLPWIQTELSA